MRILRPCTNVSLCKSILSFFYNFVAFFRHLLRWCVCCAWELNHFFSRFYIQCRCAFSMLLVSHENLLMQINACISQVWSNQWTHSFEISCCLRMLWLVLMVSWTAQSWLLEITNCLSCGVHWEINWQIRYFLLVSIERVSSSPGSWANSIGLSSGGGWLRVIVEFLWAFLNTFLVLVLNWVNRGAYIYNRQDVSIFHFLNVITRIQQTHLLLFHILVESFDRLLFVSGLDITMLFGKKKAFLKCSIELI